MAIKSVDKVIGDNKYTVQTLNVDAGMDVFGKLIQCFGPTLGAIGQGMLKGGVDPNELISNKKKLDLSKVDIKGAFQLFASNYNTPDMKFILKKLAEVTTVEGPETENHPTNMTQIYDYHFAGDMGGLFQWAKFALEVQFGNFLGEFMSAEQGAPGVQANQSVSQTTSLDVGLSSGQ